MASRETHARTSRVGTIKQYTWYSKRACGVGIRVINTGVPIVIHSEWTNYVRDVEPVDEMFYL